MQLSRPEFEILTDADALARRAADWFIAAVSAAHGAFAISLAGGTTPRRLYELLAQAPYRERVPWARAHWFWGDERFVGKDDARSNYRMVREALLSHVPIPAANIHPIPTEGSPAEAALAYEQKLRSFYGAATLDPKRPLFEVTLLGLGEDGHTASLFPRSSALTERNRWVVAVASKELEPRITLTYPALENSRHVAFLVSGREKLEVFKRIRREDRNLPASWLKPVGELRWFADAAAAGAS